MKQLIGEWHGTGTATYPSIERTTYREVLIFTPHADDLILHVEQKTWRIHPDATESLLYWESGFLRQLTDTTCEWINAQNNGRAEILRGTLHNPTPKTIVLDLRSTDFANDKRMLASTRHFEIADNTLTYSMAMSMQAHPTMQQHLTAQLTRK